MEFKIGTFSKEGFTSAHAIQCSNGLVLKTHGDMAWAGKEERDSVEQKFNELIEALEKAGFKCSK